MAPWDIGFAETHKWVYISSSKVQMLRDSKKKTVNLHVLHHVYAIIIFVLSKTSFKK